MKFVLTLLLTVFFTLVDVVVFACDVCQKQQPKIFRGVTHGAGPQSDWDFVIVGGTALVAFISLFYAVKWIVKPGEKSNEHIKRSILDIN